jgi:hypothetical protein
MKSFDEPLLHATPSGAMPTLFTEEMITIAVGYWADHLRFGGIDDEKAVARVGARGVVDKLRALPTDPAKIAVFEERLSHYLREFQRDTYGCLSTGRVWLRTDYDAQGVLYNAMKDAGLPVMGKLPFKTWMTVETILGPPDHARPYPWRSSDTLRVQFPMVKGLITVGGAVLFPTDVFECWQSDEGCSLMVSTPLEARRHKTLGILEADAEPIYAFRGTWDEVMAAHHEAQGWEPYKPFDEA